MKPKFELIVRTGIEPKRRHHKIKGFPCLEDCVAAAWGIAQRRGNAGDDIISLWLGKCGGHEAAALTVVHRGDRLVSDLGTRCDRELAKALDERKRRQARRDFTAKQPRDFHDKLMASEPMRAAFFANDFATVEKLLAPALVGETV